MHTTNLKQQDKHHNDWKKKNCNSRNTNSNSQAAVIPVQNEKIYTHWRNVLKIRRKKSINKM